jgi:hypothetical protein
VRLQDSQANCGAFALYNGLRALGIERSTEECERLCGTTATDGTPTKGLVRAASTIEDCRPVVIRERKRDIALLRLHFAVARGRPVVLSWCTRDPGDHWVTVVGLLGDRYLVADGADNELVLSLSVDALADKWYDGRYEAVVL